MVKVGHREINGQNLNDRNRNIRNFTKPVGRNYMNLNGSWVFGIRNIVKHRWFWFWSFGFWSLLAALLGFGRLRVGRPAARCPPCCRCQPLRSRWPANQLLPTSCHLSAVSGYSGARWRPCPNVVKVKVFDVSVLIRKLRFVMCSVFCCTLVVPRKLAL